MHRNFGLSRNLGILFFKGEEWLLKEKAFRCQTEKLLLARNERLELPTPGFGDQCSTN